MALQTKLPPSVKKTNPLNNKDQASKNTSLIKTKTKTSPLMMLMPIMSTLQMLDFNKD
jgi:hypothetical protein